MKNESLFRHTLSHHKQESLNHYEREGVYALALHDQVSETSSDKERAFQKREDTSKY